jgi:peptidyl-dipeptidase Dcp
MAPTLRREQITREIDKELSKLSLQFGENILAETNAFEMHLTDEKTCRITRRNYRSRSF